MGGPDRDELAHAFRVQFATPKQFEYLVCGQRRIFAHREDYLPIGGLHWEADSHSVLAQLPYGFHNVVCSLDVTAHDKLRADIIAETEESV
jgi:hypothetical protein